jgi:hypothetical protein
MFWLTATATISLPMQNLFQKERNFPDIPILNKYGGNGSAEFWKNFPSNPIPDTPSTQVNIIELSKLIEEKKSKLLSSEVNRASRCLDYLKMGGPAFQKSQLGSCVVKNSKQALEHGSSVTDTIATWISKKFVAGQFDTPPPEPFQSKLNPRGSPAKQNKGLHQRFPSRG